MTLELWRPLKSLRPADRLLDEWFDDLYPREQIARKRVVEQLNFKPSVETFVKDKIFHLRVEAPGVNPEDIDVSLKGGYLTVTGKKENKRSEEDALYHIEEFSYGTFSRTFRIPDGVNSDQISASFDGGILEVIVPLPEGESETKIPISGKDNEGKGENV